MLYRVMGPVGSGKRVFLQKMAKDAFDAGKRVFVLVPEQTSADYERELVSLLGPSCSMLLEVTNFSRLSNIVLRSFGELARRSLTAEEKKLLISRVLQEEKENLPSLSLKSDPDSVEAFLREWEELFRAGLDGEKAEEILGDASVSESLKEKIGEMMRIRARLNQLLDGRFDDPQEEENRLAAILETFPFFRGSVVIVDSFWDFTAPQERILKQLLIQCDLVGISFVTKKEDSALFEKGLLSARRLLNLANKVGCRVQDEHTEAPAEGELAFLRENLARGGKVWEGAPQSIFLTMAPDSEAQARFIARTIREKLALGCSRRDFAILTPDAARQEILALVLEEEGIPVFCERKKPLAASPLARTVLLASEIASRYPREETVREYLTRALIDVEEESLFLLEKYVATWSLSGRILLDGKDFVMSPDGYGKAKDAAMAELKLVNLAKKAVFDPIRRLSLALAEGKTEEKVSAIIAFLVQIGAEKKLLSGIQKDGNPEEKAAVVRAWNTVLERLSGIVRTLGEETCDSESFLSLLRIALSGDLPGIIPPGEDRVRIGTVGFTRPDGVQYLFVSDLNAGVFPAPAPAGRLFSDEEREVLHRMDVPVLNDAKAQNEELFRFYLACAWAQKALYLSYTAGDGEEKGGLSVFGKRVKTLFPDLKEHVFRPLEEMPYSPESAFRHFLCHAGEESPLQNGLGDFLKEEDALSQRLLTAVSAKAYEGSRQPLSTELPYEGKDVNMTYSRLEAYSKCPFSYFSSYLLEAREGKKAAFGADVTGTFVHRALEKVLLTLLTEGMDLAEVEEEDLKKRCQAACEEAAKELTPEEREEDVSMQIRALSRSVLLLLTQMQEEFKVSQFRPIYFEKELAELGGGYQIPLGDGTNLVLYGNIDRVDRYTDKNGVEYVRVIDYKTGEKSFRMEDVANGLNLQMLLYLFALWGRPLEEGGSPANPAGILYLSGLGKAVPCQSRAELAEAEEKKYFGLERDGLFVDDDALLRAQDPDQKNEFLPVPRRRNGQDPLDTRGLISLERLGRLRRKTEERFLAWAKDLRGGKIAPSPLEKGSKSPCEYCAWRPMCKRRKEDARAFQKNLTEQDLYGEEE